MSARTNFSDEPSAPATGASIVAPGSLPVKQATVTAEALARLLRGERLTSLSAVFSSSTTRLGAVVHRLKGDYRWPVESIDIAHGCRDGRVSWVSEYFLPREAVEQAMSRGDGRWCDEVRRARTALRAKAAEAERAARRANAARKSHPGQSGLFDGGAEA